MTTWQQSLVNAQTEVNRAVFELNSDGRVRPVPSDYIRQHVQQAILDLAESLALMPRTFHQERIGFSPPKSRPDRKGARR